MAHKIRIGGSGGGGLAQLIQLQRSALEFGETDRNLRNKLFIAAEGIQNAAMRGIVEQSAVVGLPMDFHQHAAQIAQQANAHRLVIHECARAAIRRDRTPQDDFAVGRNFVFRDQGESGMVFGQIEDRDRGALRRAGANARSPARACAGRQSQGIEQNGFARAGLTREHVETGRKIQRHVLDQNEVANLERREHGLSL